LPVATDAICLGAVGGDRGDNYCVKDAHVTILSHVLGTVKGFVRVVSLVNPYGLDGPRTLPDRPVGDKNENNVQVGCPVTTADNLFDGTGLDPYLYRLETTKRDGLEPRNLGVSVILPSTVSMTCPAKAHAGGRHDEAFR
jgi:hypothetical protein